MLLHSALSRPLQYPLHAEHGLADSAAANLVKGSVGRFLETLYTVNPRQCKHRQHAALSITSREG